MQHWWPRKIRLIINKLLIFKKLHIQELALKHLQLLKKSPSLVCFQPVRLLAGDQVGNLHLGGTRKTGGKSCWFEINHCLLKLLRNTWNMQLFQFKSGGDIPSLKVDRPEWMDLKWGTWARQKEKQIIPTFPLVPLFPNPHHCKSGSEDCSKWWLIFNISPCLQVC